jgi:hypothetical protein
LLLLLLGEREDGEVLKLGDRGRLKVGMFCAVLRGGEEEKGGGRDSRRGLTTRCL